VHRPPADPDPGVDPGAGRPLSAGNTRAPQVRGIRVGRLDTSRAHRCTLLLVSRLTFLLLVCLALDVSNPLLPGSQRFNPDESIDGVRVERPRIGSPSDRIVSRPDDPPAPRERSQVARATAPDGLRRPPLARRLPRELGGLAPPAEDH
jgi:hypothetical protein